MIFTFLYLSYLFFSEAVLESCQNPTRGTWNRGTRTSGQGEGQSQRQSQGPPWQLDQPGLIKWFGVYPCNARDYVSWCVVRPCGLLELLDRGAAQKKSWLVSLNMLTSSLWTHSCMVHGLSLGVPGEVGPMGYHAASCIAKGAQHSALYVPTSQQCYMQCYLLFWSFLFCHPLQPLHLTGDTKKRNSQQTSFIMIYYDIWYLFWLLGLNLNAHHTGETKAEARAMRRNASKNF